MLYDIYKEERDQQLEQLAELGYGAGINPNGSVQLHILGSVAKVVGKKFRNLTLALEAAKDKAKREARRAGDL